MQRKVLSALLLLTSISVGLGAFGHGSQWAKHVLPGVAAVTPDIVELLKLIWYWVSGTMLVFGGLLLWSAWRIFRGDSALALIPFAVGIFYFLEGVYGALRLGPFFLLFVVQAVLLWASTGALVRLNALASRSVPPGRRAAVTQE